MVLLQNPTYTASLRSKVLLGYLDGQCQGIFSSNLDPGGDSTDTAAAIYRIYVLGVHALPDCS